MVAQFDVLFYSMNMSCHKGFSSLRVLFQGFISAIARKKYFIVLLYTVIKYLMHYIDHYLHKESFGTSSLSEITDRLFDNQNKKLISI